MQDNGVKKSFLIQIQLPASANRKKLVEVFQKMKTNPILLEGIKIETSGQNKYVQLNLDDHKTLKYIMTNVIHYCIDGERLVAEELTKGTGKAHLFYQYPIHLDKKKLTKAFVVEQFAGFGKITDV